MSQTDINKLIDMLQEQNKKADAHRTAFEIYVKEDVAWKEAADKKLEVVGSVQGFGKVSLYILGFLAALGAGVTLIYKLIQWVRG